jgi:hypothetical protein
MSNLYTAVKVFVSSAQPGQNISVTLSEKDTPVAWSTGPEFSGSAGIQVTTQSGDLPLTSFYVTPSDVKFSTSSQSGGSALAFTVAAFLVAQKDITAFFLSSASDPGVEVSVQVGNAQPQIVNQTPTPFFWPS